MNRSVVVIIPAINEEASIGRVLGDIPDNLVDQVIVADNGSKDNTAEVASKNGALVTVEQEKGYGATCLKALGYIKEKNFNPEVIVFMDGDYSDYPGEMTMLTEPILKGKTDFVLGSRSLGSREKGSMTFPQVFGNRLATFLMRRIFGAKFTDLGPFRAIRYSCLEDLEMIDRNFGWTIEMQIKAHKSGIRYMEVPVSYRKRIGKSKVSGTVKGTIMAGYKILYTIAKYIR